MQHDSQIGAAWSNFFEIELQKVHSDNSYLKYLLEINRDYPKAATMLAMVKENGDDFARKVLAKAMKFNVTKAVIAIAQEYPRYLIFQSSDESAEYYTQVVKKYSLIYEAELKVKMMSAELNYDFRKKVSSGKLLEKLESYIKELDLLVMKVDSYGFQMYYYELKKKQMELREDETGTLEICQEALLMMGKKRFKISPEVTFAFTYPQLPILIREEKYAAAKKIIKKWSKYFKASRNDWFVVHSYYVILNLRKGDFRNANVLLRKVTEYSSPVVQERYKLFKAFTLLFLKDKKINTTRFVNDVYEHQKDKGGYNVAIVIIQILHYLKSGDDKSKVKFIDSIEAIDRYRLRHLQRDGRSDLFLKILLKIPKCDFRKDVFLEKTKDLRSRLDNFETRSVEVEMVKYERLYSRVLDFLK